KAIAAANRAGFTINLSANNPAHADQLAELDIAPVVTVLPASVDGAVTKTVKTPAGRTITVCPGNLSGRRELRLLRLGPAYRRAGDRRLSRAWPGQAARQRSRERRVTGDDFKAARRALGMSTKQLAIALGVASARTIRRWENGTLDIPASAVNQLRAMMPD